MNLQFLRYFVEIADQKSMNRAAETLYVTQPNLSRAVHSLEEELNEKLLERTNHGVKLTNAGEGIYYYAKSIISQLDAIDKLKRQEEFRDLSRLSVSIANMVLKDDMMLQYYQSLSASHNSISVYETGLEDALIQVENLESEIGIITYNSAQHPILKKVLELKKLDMEELAISPICVHLSRDDILASKEQVLSADLLDHTFLELPQDYFSNINRGFIFGSVHLSDFGRTITMNHYHSIINMMKHTDAFIFGGRWSEEEFMKGNIATKRLSDSDLTFTLAWVKRRKEVLSPEAEQFLKLIKNNYCHKSDE